jgi:hypothetical protein
MSRRDPELEDKERFFSALYALDHEEEKDEGYNDSVAFLTAAQCNPKRPSTAPSGGSSSFTAVAQRHWNGGPAFVRSASAPDTLNNTTRASSSKILPFHSFTSLEKHGIVTVTSHVNSSSVMAPKQKRKRDDIELVHTSRRFLKGLTLCTLDQRFLYLITQAN